MDVNSKVERLIARYQSKADELKEAVDAASESARSVTVPNEFNRVFAGYNEIQRAQGMDLSAYKGKTVESYTYTVTNYPSRPEGVQVNLYLCEGLPVAGDIFCPGAGGFRTGLQYPGRTA